MPAKARVSFILFSSSAPCQLKQHFPYNLEVYGDLLEVTTLGKHPAALGMHAELVSEYGKQGWLKQNGNAQTELPYLTSRWWLWVSGNRQAGFEMRENVSVEFAIVLRIALWG
jgi:hypothetical protein